MRSDEATATARMIVDDIISDLSDRRGLRQAWEGIDDDVLEQIRSAWIDLAVKALKGKQG